jgi:hypothetical protein
VVDIKLASTLVGGEDTRQGKQSTRYDLGFRVFLFSRIFRVVLLHTVNLLFYI